MTDAAPSPAVPGTAGYAENADALFARYESRTFEGAHRAVLHLLPAPPARVVDIGAGTGRDAAALAALGHRVLAVEPTDAFRRRAMALHPDPRIEWLSDSLPALAATRARGERFDLLMMTAVWMHLDSGEQAAAMPNVASLLAPGGVAILSLRHGAVPEGRRMFDVSAAQTAALAASSGLATVLTLPPRDDSRQPGVSWSRVAFRAPAG